MILLFVIGTGKNSISIMNIISIKQQQYRVVEVPNCEVAAIRKLKPLLRIPTDGRVC